MSLPNKAIDENHSGRPIVPAASAEDLVEHLEGLSGRVFYTTHDVNAWLAEVHERAEKEAKAGKSRKHMLLLIGALAVFLQYQIIDMMIEVSSLRASSIIAPASRAAAYRS